MGDDELLAALHAAADAVTAALGSLADWGLAGTRPGQHHSDLAADAAAVAVLHGAGLGVVSEESGARGDGRAGLVVVVDPVDGSTNAAQGIPWYATSLCALDADGPRAAVVANQASGARFEAVRGGGARADGQAVAPSGATAIEQSLVGITAVPPPEAPWYQLRALGASALDLCLVAAGGLDGYLATGAPRHGPWDYFGALLVCREAGVELVDGAGQDLVVLDHDARRAPIAGAAPHLTDDLAADWRRAAAP